MEGERGWKKGTEDGTILLTREYIYIYFGTFLSSRNIAMKRY